MRKSLGFIATASSYLLLAASAFAQNVTIAPPAGSIGNICLTRVPQFLIQLVFIIGIVIAVIFLIFGGVKWILSGGDKSAVETARNHIVAAIVGLVIVVGAFFIIGLIFQLLGQPNPVTNLTINDLAGNPLKCP
ncbi:pilin [Patescibacteria group bacterium]|nr:pilin [Patescibacteria group bacterium]